MNAGPSPSRRFASGPSLSRNTGEGHGWRTQPHSRVALGVTVASCLLLTACAGFEVDWHRTGQLWLGALCDGASQCSYDGDGDPMTRW